MTEIIIHVLHMRKTEAWRVKVADSKSHVELEEMLKLKFRSSVFRLCFLEHRQQWIKVLVSSFTLNSLGDIGHAMWAHLVCFLVCKIWALNRFWTPALLFNGLPRPKQTVFTRHYWFYTSTNFFPIILMFWTPKLLLIFK